MNSKLTLFNSLSRKKELFVPLHPPRVGMYVCGPTVYGDPHLGHARPAITFDIVFRYLKYLGYEVRYVRNITDVGHLEHDSDDGEDKIEKKARLEKLEPMEIAQFYTNRYVRFMNELNVLSPGIEPRASGHIPEQIELIEQILEAGYGYIAEGSVYFDVRKYNESHNYGILSGRKVDELLSNTRELEGQQEKRFFADFALWKKAAPEHIMKWNSPWSKGFPGWHLECSAMGKKYLGQPFDIHGGGMDLLFPHHESEIAQCVAGSGEMPAKYWIHNNMITINGQKMGKSLGNFITLDEFFTGSHALLEQVYTPLTIRFFILQAHYRSTLDFSNHALKSAEKALQKLTDAFSRLHELKATEENKAASEEILKLRDNALTAMNDDFNTPIVLVQLFDASRIINQAASQSISLGEREILQLKELFTTFFIEILGISDDSPTVSKENDKTKALMEIILDLRKQAKENKNYQLSDFIRNQLEQINIVIKDTKDGVVWENK